MSKPRWQRPRVHQLGGNVKSLEEKESWNPEKHMKPETLSIASRLWLEVALGLRENLMRRKVHGWN